MINTGVILDKATAIVALIAITISFVGLFSLIKILYFCIKRYVLFYFGINTELSTIVFNIPNIKSELSINDIVTKRILKEKIDKFARETYNMVKANNYLSEREDNVSDKEYEDEIKKLSDVYIYIDKIKIDTREDLEEVTFLFNNGKLRSNEEIIEYYKNRELSNRQKEYRKNGFINKVLSLYKETEITTKIISNISMIFISGLYFYVKVRFKFMTKWTIKDVLMFVVETFKIVFDPFYYPSKYNSCYAEDGETFFFCLSLLISITISILIGWFLILILKWSNEIKLFKEYQKAGRKKKPDIMLGINTASYLYFLHKLLKKRG